MSTIIDENLLVPDRWGLPIEAITSLGDQLRTVRLVIKVVSRPRREIVRNTPGPTSEDFLK